MPELLPFEPGSPEWLAARRQGVTATDIVTILGLSHRDNVYSLFWRKMGQIPDEPDHDRLALGRALEPYIAARWTEENHRALGDGHLWRHSERSWQMATTDRGVQTGTSVRPVELKSWADADKRAWDTAPPPAVRAQVLWQMDVMGVSTGHVGVIFLPSGEFRSYTIEHDYDWHHEPHTDPGMACDICTDLRLMRQAGEEFMRRLRLELPPPDPDSSLASLAAVRARFAKVPAKQAEVDAGLWEVYAAAVESIRMQEGFKRAAEIQLREQAGEAAELCVDGQVVARRIITDAHVQAHVRHQDYLRRVKQQGDDE